MCDDVFDEDSECDLALQSKEYDKMNSDIETSGFRDGLMEAKEKFLQKGFDEGLEDSFTNFTAINVLKGIVNVVHFTIDTDERREILNNIVAKIESLEQELSNLEQVSLEQVSVKRDHLDNLLAETKSKLKDLCTLLELSSIHDQIDECQFKFNQKALERLAVPLESSAQ